MSGEPNEARHWFQDVGRGRARVTASDMYEYPYHALSLSHTHTHTHTVTYAYAGTRNNAVQVNDIILRTQGTTFFS